MARVRSTLGVVLCDFFFGVVVIDATVALCRSSIMKIASSFLFLESSTVLRYILSASSLLRSYIRITLAISSCYHCSASFNCWAISSVWAKWQIFIFFNASRYSNLSPFIFYLLWDWFFKVILPVRLAMIFCLLTSYDTMFILPYNKLCLYLSLFLSSLFPVYPIPCHFIY